MPQQKRTQADIDAIYEEYDRREAFFISQYGEDYEEVVGDHAFDDLIDQM